MVIFARKDDILHLYKKHRKIVPDMLSIEKLRHEERRLPQNFFLKISNYQIDRIILNKKPDSNFVHFCLASVHVLGVSEYKKIAKKWKLIPEHILIRMFDDVKFRPGINRTLNQIISLKFELATKPGRLCTIILDDVPLKRHISSNADELVDGYEDDGVRKTATLAKFATYVVVRGMFADWKLPVAYTLNAKPPTADQLQSLLFSVLREMKKLGLVVKAVIGKLRAHIYELVELLGVSTSRQTFTFEGQDYYFMFDAPNLMTSTRNNLLKYEIRFDGREASWRHLLGYYCRREVLRGVTPPLITLAHVRPDRENLRDPNNAIQVLSCRVARDMADCMSEGLLQRSATGTVKFISFFGRLFNFMNSWHTRCLEDFCEAYTGCTAQLKFIEENCRFLDGLRVHNDSRDITDDVKFIRAWKINLLGLPKMWADVQREVEAEPEGQHHLKMHRVQASGTMFDYIAGAPSFTPAEFRSYYQFCFIRQYLEQPFCVVRDHLEYMRLVSEKIPSRRGDDDGASASGTHVSV